MKERPIVIGSEPGLIAVLTEPAAGMAGAARPACLLLNAGLVHRVGPNRLHVRLARALAAAGYRALRLDLSGRGDSDVRRDGVSFVEGSVIEIRSAMDCLEASGSTRFVLMGICSGGLNGLQVAMVDSRVVGCVAVDGPTYPTPVLHVRSYARRVLRLESWRNTLAGQNSLGRVLRLRSRGSHASAAGEEPEANPFGDVRVPTQAEAAESLKGILARGTRLLLRFTGSWTAYNHQGQFAEAFPFIRDSDTVKEESYPTSDRTFTRLSNQQRLVDTICAWMTERWPIAERGQHVEVEERQAVP